MRLSGSVNKALRPSGVELRRVQPGEPMRTYEMKTRPNRRLRHFQHLVGLIEDVPGDVVECGVGAWKTRYMLAALIEHGRHSRRVWAFDSFAGLPPRTREDRADSAPRTTRAGIYAHSEDDVQARLVEYGITKPQLRKRFTFVNWVRGDTGDRRVLRRRPTRHPRRSDQESLVSGQVGAGRFGPGPHRNEQRQKVPRAKRGHVGGRDRG
jgi:Macrocin-O-methyltransferase (TylF)